ncbi:MAG: hypothetical protein LUC93_11195 [Planctomycetaceae bacterium]|nr:hypothetical protein [Planctomycetaceae bacterium]
MPSASRVTMPAASRSVLIITAPLSAHMPGNALAAGRNNIIRAFRSAARSGRRGMVSALPFFA